MSVDIFAFMHLLFRALGDETRLRILDLLTEGERCVCDLQSDLQLGQSLLSFHLRVLREAGLVRDRRAGRWSFYALNTEALDPLSAHLDDLRTRTERALPVADSCC
jgi:ArsR family transcriptional regulator, arsenate/arsenite/antimonite-responsive transcriptional repressor